MLAHRAGKKSQHPWLNCDECLASKSETRIVERANWGCGRQAKTRDKGPLSPIVILGSKPVSTCPGYLARLSKVNEALNAYHFAHKDGMGQQLSQLEDYHPTLPADLVFALQTLSYEFANVLAYERDEQEMKLKGK